MNRIICDICGSEYPETADRCPICSYPRQGTEQTIEGGETGNAEAKVKGGRFSSRNVRKRTKARKDGQARRKDPNRALWITVILLLAAILLVSLYIGIRFFRGRDLFQGGTTTASTTLPTGTTVPPTVPCEQIELEANVILDDAGQEYQIVAKLTPANTTDAVTYVSSEPAVAEVTERGLVIANGPGQTVITVTCGEATGVCNVFCWFQEETTVPVETTQPTVPSEPAETTKPTEPAPAPESRKLTLSTTDATCYYLGETFTLSVKLGSTRISRSDVTWTTSDPSIATVEEGKVVAVGKGTATITAEYQGKKAKCIVRCQFDDTNWRASSEDVTLSVGESFRLTVKNRSGETADAIWTMSREGVVSIDGKTVTGRAPGTVTLTTTVDGVTMTCIVRVK